MVSWKATCDDLNVELGEAEEQLVKSRKLKNDMLEAQLEAVRLKALIGGLENTEKNLIEQVLTAMQSLVASLSGCLQTRGMSNDLCSAQMELMQIQGEVKVMKAERDASRESCQEATEAMAASQQSEKLVTQERDRLQKEVEALVATAGDEGMNASYIETMKAGYEEQIKEMNDQVLELQTAAISSRKEHAELDDANMKIKEMKKGMDELEERKRRLEFQGNVSKEQLDRITQELSDTQARIVDLTQEVEGLEVDKKGLTAELERLKVVNRAQELSHTKELEARTTNLKKKAEKLQRELTASKVRINIMLVIMHLARIESKLSTFDRCAIDGHDLVAFED